MADDDVDTEPVEAEPAPKRKRGPRKHTAAPRTSARVERRGHKIEQTIKEIARWATRNTGSDDLGFADTLERDASQIGLALAGVAERFKPFGLLVDTLFGEGGPISVLTALSSAIRAGRRSLAVKAQERKARQEAERAAQEVPQPDGFAASFEPDTAGGAYQE